MPVLPTAGSGAERASRLALAAVLALAIATALAHAFLASPVNDDYALAHEGRQHGALRYALEQVYPGWSGRWAGHAWITGCVTWLDPTRAYWVPILLVMALDLLAFYALARLLLGDGATRRTAAASALALYALLWCLRPYPQETVYWASGAIAYELPLALALLVFVGLCRLASERLSRGGRIAGASALALGSFLVPGFHEMYGGVLCVALGAGSFFTFRAGSRARGAWLVALACAVAGTLVVLLAPGNARRAGTEFGGAASLARTLEGLRFDALAVAPEWVLDARLLLASLLVALAPGLAALRPAWLASDRLPGRRAVPALWLATLAASAAAVHWTTGLKLYGRLLDAHYALFAVGWFVSLFLWTRPAPAEPPADSPSLARLRAASALLLATGLLLTGNLRAGLGDLVAGGTLEHRRAVGARHAQLRAWREAGAPGGRLAALPPTPRLYLASSVGAEREHVMNRALARYFELEWVAAEVAGGVEGE